ncbi:MAG: hypothetical protein KBA06_00215 [Saprospiraceae bacterium]|nr:hypothetical protein [Saprospiraceae bacterium]
MKNKLSSLIFVVGVLQVILFSCKTSMVNSPLDYEKRAITFGKGGGFTGKETSYVLLQNGQLFEKKSDSVFVQVALIEKKLYKSLFADALSNKLDQIQCNKPGNMYYFVAYDDAKKKISNKITWGDANAQLESKVKEFYKEINKLIPQDNQ